ncbi:MAG: glycosyltransferase family 39 protein [Myxococcota bacterium]|nr:glycosyltransferase family 39 protein [Myxococcota bacterium]
MKFRWSYAVALLLAGYFTILALNGPAIGFVRDEGYYFKAADQYAGWWETLFSRDFTKAFTDKEIQKHFSYNTEHPPLVKLSQGITHRLFHKALGWSSPSAGYRIAGYLFACLSLLATFLLGRLLFSSAVGFFAACLLATIPRYFFDAHLACFDVPITAMWTLSLWAFWRSYGKACSPLSRSNLLAGLIFGLAIATKLNALFLPFVFVFTWLWTSSFLKDIRMQAGPSGGTDIRLGTIPWVLIVCAVVGPLIFFVAWPHLWHDPIGRTNFYLSFHLNHEHYPAQYFGNLLVKPPFPISFPFVMTALTVPVPLLALGTLGFLTAAYQGLIRREPRYCLLFAACALPPFVIAGPNTPIFGGVKHWYNAMPLFAVLASSILIPCLKNILAGWSSSVRFALITCITVFTLLPGVLGILASPTTGIGYYNSIAGGYQGGARLGMQRGFWGGLVRPNLEGLRKIKPGSRVFFNRLNYDSYRMYVKEGVLPSRVYYANEAKSASAAFHFEQPEHGEQEGAIWSVLGTQPVCGVYVDNVTLGQLYSKDPEAVCVDEP